MHSWIEELEDHHLINYTPGFLLGQALAEARVLNALLADLEVPGTLAQLKRLPLDDKLEAIEKVVEYRRSQKTSLWYEAEPLEAVTGELWHSTSLPKKWREFLWPSRKKEADLLMPVAHYLSEQEFEVYDEIPTGRKRLDVLGRQEQGLIFKDNYFVGVELKNALSQLSRGLDQMTTFGQYVHEIYLAVTPALCMEFLAAHGRKRNVKRWDSTMLDEKLERAGIGLLLVFQDGVAKVIEAPETEVSSNREEEVLAQMTRKRLVEL